VITSNLALQFAAISRRVAAEARVLSHSGKYVICGAQNITGQGVLRVPRLLLSVSFYQYTILIFDSPTTTLNDLSN
jgi:hypothetical protein